MVERRRSEGAPFAGLLDWWRGWSRPLYGLLLVDLLAVQVFSAGESQPGMWVSIVHALLLIALSLFWAQRSLPYGAVVLGFCAVLQGLGWMRVLGTDPPPALALLALGYGLVGYGLEYARSLVRGSRALARTAVLERPLEIGAQVIAVLALLWAALVGIDVWRWLARGLLGRPMMTAADAPVAQMVVTVLALTGLLYLAMALVRRWNWRGYGAVALLLCAWSLEWFLVWGSRQVQWYAAPAGLYLLGVGYFEWREGRKGLARWIDHAGLLLLLGSAFYQSLAETNGWPYALLMGAESLLVIWWGSARRQRRFLYLGVIGIVAAVCGQLIEPLLSVNRWIVLGVVGMLIVATAILIERSLERARRLSQEWKERLDKWE
jgi:hypothetical protein